MKLKKREVRVGVSTADPPDSSVPANLTAPRAAALHCPVARFPLSTPPRFFFSEVYFVSVVSVCDLQPRTEPLKKTGLLLRRVQKALRAVGQQNPARPTRKSTLPTHELYRPVLSLTGSSFSLRLSVALNTRAP